MCLTNEELEELPEAVRDGKISVKDALGKLAEGFRMLPYFRNITKDDDITSDMVLSLLQHGQYLFLRYDRKFGKFMSYFASYMRLLYRTARRKKVREQFNALCVSVTEHENFFQNEEKYFQDEYCCRALKFKPYFPSIPDRLPYKIRRSEREISQNSPNYAFDPSENENDACKTKISQYCREKHRIEKKIALAVSLKSCYYLDDEHIEAISSFCEIPKDELTDTVEKLRFSLHPRIEKFEEIKNRRDRAYFLHRRYKLRLDYCLANMKDSEEIRNLYEFHTKNWLEKNSILQEKTYPVCPTNKVIADILGVCERQVGYFLNNAKRLEKLAGKNND